MSDDADERELHAGGDLRSFGRRRGRKVSAHQRQLLDDLLPRVAVDIDALRNASAQDLAVSVFQGRREEIWLEIGFGGGEHLVWQARHNSGVGLIGCEPFEEGVVKVLSAIDEGGLDHVRLWADDVRPLLRALPAACIARVFILFPDPWPKRRHTKRRLVQPNLVTELARIMRPGAILRFSTDIEDYLRTALLSLSGNPDFFWLASRPQDWRCRSEDWPATRYEAKAVREGRRSYYLTFQRR